GQTRSRPHLLPSRALVPAPFRSLAASHPAGLPPCDRYWRTTRRRDPTRPVSAVGLRTRPVRTVWRPSHRLLPPGRPDHRLRVRPLPSPPPDTTRSTPSIP